MTFRPSILALLVAAFICLGAPAAGARPAHGAPSARTLSAAVARARTSRSLWATVNICNTRRHPDTIGIRGEMPALGFPSRLQMTFKLFYWKFTEQRFVPVPRVSVTVALGAASTGTRQSGVTFKFRPPVILSGEITFQWRIGRRVLARVTRLTGHGYSRVDQGDPSGYSTAQCRIPG
ncbi:MAG: hypothetical protein ACYC91_05440 [Solirubrobacteraceae bacterium]